MVLMLIFEYLDLTVSLLTLVVLAWTLWFVRRYVADTKTLADTAAEQSPRPCVVLKQYPDSSADTVLEKETTTLIGDLNFGSPLIFSNVGTGPAVNCRYSCRDMEKKEPGEVQWWSLPGISPQACFESQHILNSLPGDNLTAVRIQYESVGGSHYRTDLVILERRWVKESKFTKLS